VKKSTYKISMGFVTAIREGTHKKRQEERVREETKSGGQGVGGMVVTSQLRL